MIFDREPVLVPDLDRRLFLNRGVDLAKSYLLLAAARPFFRSFAVDAAPNLTTSVAANGEDEVIEGDIVPWSTPDWFPLVADVARQRRMLQIYPFLRKFGVAYRNKYPGEEADAEGWERNFAENPRTGLLPTLSGGEYLSAGFCHANGNAGVWETPPLDGETTKYGITYNKVDRIAWMAIKYAGAMPDGFSSSRQGIEDMLRYFESSRIPLVANIPLNEPGSWWRVVYQLIRRSNRSFVKVTNFSENREDDLVVPVEAIRSIYLPKLPRDSQREDNLNLKWRNPEVFKDGGVLLDELINS